MTAAAAPITTPMEEAGAGALSLPLADNVKIYKGTMVCLDNAGLARPASDAANRTPVIGIAEDTMDNTQTGHAAGAWPPAYFEEGVGNWIRVRFGVVATVKCTSATQAMVGTAQAVYVSDDNNVVFSGTSHTVSAGRVAQYHSATEIGMFIPPMTTVVALSS